MEKDVPAWGGWIKARMRFLGFRRDLDFAASVGCSRNQLSKWLQLKVPPNRMLKGLDQRLAYALETTKGMLFRDYFLTAAEAAPRVLFHIDQMPASDVGTYNPEQVAVLKKLIDQLPPSKVETLLQIAAILGRENPTEDTEMVHRRFSQINEAFKLGELVPSLPVGAGKPVSIAQVLYGSPGQKESNNPPPQKQPKKQADTAPKKHRK